MSKAPAPRGLGTAGRKLWRSIDDEYELEQHEQLTLLEACRIADRLHDLSAAQAGADLTTVNARGDVVASPYLVEARQQQVVFLRTLASLRLPTGEEDERPQRRGAARGAYAPRAGLRAVE